MATLVNKHLDEVYIEIKDKPEIGFLDFEYDQSLQNYNPQDEGPIVISIPFPFVNGKPQSAFIGETSADSISIENSTCDPVELWHVRIYFQDPEDSYILSLMKPPSADTSQEAAESFVGMTSLENMVLQPGQTLTVWLSCKPKDIGLHTAIVHFDLWDERFERVVFLLGEDKASWALFSKRPHTRAPPHGRRAYYDKHVAGYHPPQSSKNQRRKFRLSEYPIPKEIREMVENKQVPDVIMEGLNGRSYAKYFSILIAMEEIHLEEEMRARDMEHVTMKKRGKHFLSLEVPGLAERRPSLVCGDYIFASHATEDPANDKHYYQGYIHRVEADKIFVKFGDNFHRYHRDEDLLNVYFTYDRVNMRRLYQAVNEAENLGSEFLFPSQSYQRRVVRTSPLKPLNPFLNKEQLHSVEMILGCKGAPPYVIHGPPGTGKTSTLVEAILQLYTTRRRTRILVCASSNSAADHVLEILLEKEGVVKENEIFRLNAASRPYEDVQPDLICFCFFSDVIFTCPPRKALLNYKIIISTYMSASLLHAEGINKGYFSHIFLDDAGQASEPETMVPLSNLCAADTVIVLAGDPMQLAPVVYSRTAERHGLGKSYMERLFECDYYKSDENYVTKLVRNYRCHPAILELPSRLFYKGKLVPCREDNNSSIYDWEELPNKAFPVLFVGIQGCDEREGNNPSWFNRIEASKVVEIVRKLMRNTDISEADIGIITPYRQQVLKLKIALELLEMPDVKVGNVEKFQGQERQIIIISTVRSTVKYNEFDRTHNLGFLNNPRRFNVSTTRAKSLLIIVGNPHIISKDPYWDILLRHCADNGSYIGCPLPPPEKHYYINEAPKYEGGQDIPSLYSNEVERGQDVPSQYSKEVEWGQDVPSHYSNEVDWDDGSVNQYSNEAGRYEDTLRQNFEETGWRNDMLKQYSNEAGWDGDSSNHNSRGSRRSVSIPKVRIFKWGDVVMDKDTLKQYSHETVWKSDITEPHSNEAGWSEDKSNWNSSKNGKNVSIPKASNFGWGDEFDD